MQEVNDIPDSYRPQDTVGGRYVFHHMIWTHQRADGGSGRRWIRRRRRGAGLAGARSRPQRRSSSIDAGARCCRPARASSPTRRTCTRTAATRRRTSSSASSSSRRATSRPCKRARDRPRQRRRHRHQGRMEANQQLHAYTVLQEHTKIISFEPHLHAPGARMCLEAIWGYNIQTLTCVGYDHNWVRGYDYDRRFRAAAAEGHHPAHHRLHGQLADEQERARSAQLAGLGQSLGREHVHRPRAARGADRRAVPGGDGEAPREAEADGERRRHRLSAVQRRYHRAAGQEAD